MDTNRIKRFATEARNILKAGIAAKMLTLGFDKNGNVAEENKPLLMQGGSVWNGQLQTEGFYHQWIALYNRIQQIGIKDVYEETAYTWFNRLCAIRILQKNNLCSPVLAYADAARTPVIVDEARQGRIPQMKEEMRQRLMELLDDDTKVTEQFAILITAWCHENPIVNQCFGSMADYTELLLPNNILAEGGFVDLLNHTEFITDDDFHSPELIGWLYQFYISERKDEVFAKKGKFEADEIPAATQIFTPNWIVKYMVQNTVGRIYLDNNPYETQLQKKWQYLVGDVSHVAGSTSHVAGSTSHVAGSTSHVAGSTSHVAGSTSHVATAEKPSCGETPHLLHYDELTDLKVADLACGSGHILNECFDLLYDLYIAEGYGRGEAVENIFRHNLTGIDLDTRAKQLATFALLLKACQKDAAFADAHVLPNVLDMTGVVPALGKEAMAEACLQFVGGYENVAGEMLEQDFELLREADNLGSIMKFNDDKDYLDMLRAHYEDWTNGGTDDCPADIKQLLPGVKVILALTEHYHALVMNPPYMGGGKMNSVLSKYVKENYEEAKADLFSVFMDMGMERLAFGGKMAQINMQSWMFLSSFEKLRNIFLHNYIIDSMLHLGPRTFDELSGEVVQNTAFVLTKPQDPYGRITLGEVKALPEAEKEMWKQRFMEDTEKDSNEWVINNAKGTYYRLVDGKNCADKEQLFLSHKNGNEDGNRIYYPNVEQKNFEKIPGCPIGYWVSEKIFETFTRNRALSAVANPCVGLQTADNARFLRLWFEVGYNRIGFGCENAASAARSQKKWFPYNKGGGSRRWYGQQEYLINWWNDGEDVRNNKGAVIRNPQYYFQPSISWSKVSSSAIAFRYYPKGFIFADAGMSIFSNEDLQLLSAYCNSCVCASLISLMSPTMNYEAGQVSQIPYKSVISDNNILKKTADENISISKQDWDAHETSWDFQRNELLSLVGDVSHVANGSMSHVANGSTSHVANGSTSHVANGSTSHVANGSTSHVANGSTSHVAASEMQGSSLCGETPHLLRFVNKKEYIHITGNKLPHWNQGDCVQFVTFRLADSLPQAKLKEYGEIKEKWLAEHPKPWDTATKDEYENEVGNAMDKWIDAGYGECILKDERVRKIVADAILHFNDERYDIHAFVIMPNHVHVLLSTRGDNLVQNIVGSWKKFSAHEINKLLGREGSVWERESFDHMVRNEDSYKAKLDYIINNPQHLSFDQFTLVVGDVSHVANGSMSHVANGSMSHVANGSTSHVANGNTSHVANGNTSHVANGSTSHVAATEKLTSGMCGETPHLLNVSLEELMEKYKQKWERKFMQLHANEEELNRQFIDIYGLQDELTPDVPLDEITILQQGEISIE